MKFFTSLIIFIFLIGKLAAQPPGSVIDVERYVFNVELNDKDDLIAGIATIHFKFLQAASAISFDLISQKTDGKGMKIISVTENGKELKYTHSRDILSISFPMMGKPGEQKTLLVKYGGIPADGLIIAKNKYNQRTFFSDHWPNRARNWLPCIDHPAEKAAVEFVVTAPLHYQVVSNGVLIEETNLDVNRRLTHYKETTPLPMKICAIGVADFAVRFEGEVDRIPVQSWVFAEDRAKGFYDYGLAVDMLPYFIKNIGPYPFKKLANVQSKTVYGGMENAGAIFYAEKSITGKRSSEVLIAHEIGHQWFGDMATEADFSHLWLSEGFVTYIAILYMEQKYGIDTATKMRIEDRMQAIAYAKQKSAPVVDSTTRNYLELLNANSYQKGGWALHMLRRQLGDSVFWNCLRSYYAQYAGKNAVTDDFRKVVEKVSGKDLQQFFRQWLFTAGHPILDIQWKYNKASSSLTINIVQQQSVMFEFPLQVNVITTDGDTVSQSFAINNKQNSFTFPLPGAPRKILADPGADLLYEGTVRENR